MGGTSGEVRGTSKSETYHRYAELVERQGDMLPDRNPDPVFKKFCKKQMVQDSETGEWVLHYRLHT